MASTGNLWWMTPLQAVATLGAAVNFGMALRTDPTATRRDLYNDHDN